MANFEIRLTDYVLGKLKQIKAHYHIEQDVPKSWTDALANGSKSGQGTARVDFAITYPDTRKAVIIENKWGLDKLEKTSKQGLASQQSAIKNYAVNGALFYAYKLIDADVIDTAIIIGVAGEGEVDSLQVNTKTYYVFSSTDEPKFIEESTNLNLDNLSTENYLDTFKDAELTEEERSALLNVKLGQLKKHAKELNKLMNNYSITVDQRVIYVSGMLLAMQGRNPVTKNDLQGKEGDYFRDGKIVENAINDFLSNREHAGHLRAEKKQMMLNSFSIISADPDRDVVRSDTGKSITKEIFDYIYDNVFKLIDADHVDSLGLMYSEFLKYATGDGKDNGIVLTPAYTTKLMNQLINLNYDDRVFDPATGSAGFLVSSMDMMSNLVKQDANLSLEEKEAKLTSIRANQLMGIEYDMKMYTLATTNMILRGDGSSNIQKADSFILANDPQDPIGQFAPTKALANPPFSYSENGMPFAKLALDKLAHNGLLALIIQDSAGTGKAIKTNKQILKQHTLLASIRMPADLFQPSAGVQTSIYLFKAGTPHDYNAKVKFIDFSNDGYKRTGRGTRDLGDANDRYKAVLEIFKYGKIVSSELASIDDIDYIEDVITESGADWNYTQHQVIDTSVSEEDFIDTVSEYLSWQVSQALAGK